MIKVENVETFGWEAAIRGMRNPKNSWDRSDSFFINGEYSIGKNDLGLMTRLFKAGTEHRKYLRMVHIQMDVTAPLYWFKEYDTYKCGTTANSCSTMHKIADKSFELKDFSIEHLNDDSIEVIQTTIDKMNEYRILYNNTKDKNYWWQMIQLLPTPYNQKRTIDFNYETAVNIIRQRSGHKLDEWHTFVSVLKNLPYMKELLEVEL